jgi:tellurite resistance protein
MEITYKSIQSYLLSEEQDEDNMKCTFHIENKKFDVQAALVSVSKGSTELMSQMVNKSGVGLVRSMLRSILKKNTGGNNDNNAENKTAFTKKDREAAVVTAFESMLNEIVYDRNKEEWQIAKNISEFEKRIKKNPLTEINDKKIMSRMLVEMARADGRIEENERLFFEDFLNDDTGRLGDLMRTSFLTSEDCSKASKESRPIIFLIVCAVALTDNDFNREEQQKLNAFAGMLGIEEGEKEELLGLAQDYTLQLIIKSKNHSVSDEELHLFADKIGMDRIAAGETQKRLNQ